MNAKTPLTVLSIAAVVVVALAALFFMKGSFGSLGLPNPFGKNEIHAEVDPVLITLLPPPAATSAETKKEIATLIQDKFERSTEVITAIQKEASIDAVQVGPYTVGEYREGKILPLLAKALSYSLPEVERVLALKQDEFKRPRPSMVDQNVEPVIAVPHNPSYPADYASKARFVAYVLSYVDKAHEADYLSYAEEVAKRQEIAGLQYPLDNAVGAMFAEMFFTEVMKDPAFVALLDAAKTEWASTSHPTEEAPQ
jgi:hypothetical protein